MRKLSLLLVFSAVSVSLVLSAFGQTAPVLPKPVVPKIDNEFVQKQFGNQFTMLSEIPPVFGDLNGDGVEDVVIAARCKNPMIDQAEHNYKVMDPYYDFFGYGDPKVTTTFSEPIPERRGLVMLIIAGAGPEGWHSAKPGAKYVIVNMPYRSICVRKMKLRKKNIDALYIVEASETGDSSALVYDGRKFRYVPMGGDME
jgi:hypothetical protein